jgi:hypothetical protein
LLKVLTYRQDARRKEQKMQKFMQVPVPERFVMKVYRLLTKLEAEEKGYKPSVSFTEELRAEEKAYDPPVSVAEKLEEHDAALWSTDELRRVHSQSPSPIRKFFDYLADNPDRVVQKSELAKFIYGDDPKGGNRLSGALGAFGRRVKGRHPGKSWPFQAEWNHERGEMEYMMDVETAETIRSFRS